MSMGLKIFQHSHAAEKFLGFSLGMSPIPPFWARTHEYSASKFLGLMSVSGWILVSVLRR